MEILKDIAIAVIAGLVTIVINWLWGNRIKLPNKATRVRQKIGSVTCKIVGHNCVDKEINYPAIYSVCFYSECVACGAKNNKKMVSYKELERRNKKKSP